MSSFTVALVVAHIFSCSFRKPLHKRADGKEVSQEENFLPKYQRVKDLCQRAEYQTSCQQPGQVLDVQDFRNRVFSRFSFLFVFPDISFWLLLEVAVR